MPDEARGAAGRPGTRIADWGREVCGRLAVAESLEWLSTNGLGGFATGTVAGLLTRCYHGLLVAALSPPLERTLLVAKVDDSLVYDGINWPLFVNRWADGSVDPEGYRAIERFCLQGTSPVWTYACADALLEKRIWMEQGANTTYIHYRLLRARGPAELTLKVLVNYRDSHGRTRAGDWRMVVTPVPDGLRILAYPEARPLLLLASGGKALPTHEWYYAFQLAAERERGLDWQEDHLHAGTFRVTLGPGEALTLVCSVEAAPSLDGEAAWARRQDHERALLTAFRSAAPAAQKAPAWVEQLAVAADQFVVSRPLPDDAGGRSVIAGYPWFADWGRDTMISLPGLLLATGRAEVARRVLATFVRFLRRGLIPNRFPDRGEAPEYNSVDGTLWYVQAVRAYHDATEDTDLLRELFPALEEGLGWLHRGTCYGIAEDPSDGLLRAGGPGVQLTWMDVKVGDWVVTPRTGKPVEVNSLWYNALRAMAGFARRLGRPAEAWEQAAARTRAGFDRFWNGSAGYCYDVLDGPAGHEDALRPNQILAVSLPESPLPPERQRQVVDACARHLLTAFGLRSLAPGHPQYRGSYTGNREARDAAYHQGTAWAWLLGPFALAHLRVYRDPAAARAYLSPLAYQLADYGVGTLGEIFDGDPPFLPRGCIAQAWSVAETLRAWLTIAGQEYEAPAP